MGRLGDRRGFALPLTILLIALLTVMLSSGFARVRADRQVANASTDMAAAVAVAQSGLQSYLGTLNTDACERPIRPSDGDSTRINVTGGYADVVAYVAQRPLDTLANWLYVVRSTGYVINPSSSVRQAKRTVAQFAQWQSGTIDMPAAFVAANGLTRASGGSGQLHGADENWPSSCRIPNRYGVLTPSDGVPSPLTDFNLTGVSPYVQGWSNPKNVADSTHVDWFETITGVLEPDYTTIQTGNWNYPVMVVPGNATLGLPGQTTYGTGLLVVGNTLTIQGNFVQWYGVILVGGRIRFDANDQRFDGYIASGLNAQLGIAAGSGQIGGNYLDIDLNSSFIRQAMAPLSGFAPIGNAWTDGWKDY